MKTLQTFGQVDGSHTLAVVVPHCGVSEGRYEVLVMLDEAGAVRPQTDGYHQWLAQAAGSARPGRTTEALLAQTRGED